MVRFLTLFGLILFLLAAFPQHLEAQKYDLFEVKNNDLFWRYTFEYKGSQDSLRREVVQMLKSKFFTFGVTRNEVSYSGEIRHYKVPCEKYGRTYFNTPRMYWDGEWTGKFIIDISDNAYRVTIYALYYEKMEKSTSYYKTEKPVKGRYINAVLKKKRHEFKKNEFANMQMMSLGLKDDFDIKKTVIFKDGK